MIRSMTGFGEASTQAAGIHYSVELRSLNNRYFKPTVRLPEPIAGLEAELETLLRKRLMRGSIVLNVRMAAAAGAVTSLISEEAVLKYLEHLETIHAKVHASSNRSVNIDLTALLALPGVIRPAEEDTSLLRKSRPVVADLLEEACVRLLEMRLTEGRLLAEDLDRQRQDILQRLAQVQQRAPAVVEEYHQRLSARVEDLAARAKLEIDKADLIREVAIFADRADITEELARIKVHLEHFAQIIASAEGTPAGRTLDFVAQELLREANTIASKSNDAPISRAIVEIKSSIDRIKEQVQNVE